MLNRDSIIRELCQSLMLRQQALIGGTGSSSAMSKMLAPAVQHMLSQLPQLPSLASQSRLVSYTTYQSSTYWIVIHRAIGAMEDTQQHRVSSCRLMVQSLSLHTLIRESVGFALIRDTTLRRFSNCSTLVIKKLTVPKRHLSLR